MQLPDFEIEPFVVGSSSAGLWNLLLFPEQGPGRICRLVRQGRGWASWELSPPAGLAPLRDQQASSRRELIEVLRLALAAG